MQTDLEAFAVTILVAAAGILFLGSCSGLSDELVQQTQGLEGRLNEIAGAVEAHGQLVGDIHAAHGTADALSQSLTQGAEDNPELALYADSAAALADDLLGISNRAVRFQGGIDELVGDTRNLANAASRTAQRINDRDRLVEYLVGAQEDEGGGALMGALVTGTCLTVAGAGVAGTRMYLKKKLQNKVASGLDAMGQPQQPQQFAYVHQPGSPPGYSPPYPQSPTPLPAQTQSASAYNEVQQVPQPAPVPPVPVQQQPQPQPQPAQPAAPPPPGPPPSPTG